MTKATVVLSLAIFQVSFFMKPNTSQKIERNVAQEVVVGGETIDLSVTAEPNTIRIRQTDPTGTTEIISVDEVDYSDLIPENLPAQATFQEALDAYELKVSQCVVKEEDMQDINALDANLQEKKRIYTNSRTSENYQAARIAYYDFARKLVNLGLLENFESAASSAPSNDDISAFDVGLSSRRDSDRPSTNSSSIFLNEDNATDLRQIGECHLAILEDLETEEEKRAYFEEHNVARFVDAIRGSLSDSPEELQSIANEYYTQAQTADGQTQNLNGFNYSAQTHGQSAMAVHSITTEIKSLEQRLAANPTDTTIATALTQARANLVQQLSDINARSRAAAAADPALAGNESLLARAYSDIDTATTYWALEADKVITGQQATLFSDYSPSVSPTVANPSGAISLNFDNSVLTGSGTPGLDPNNGMLLPPTGLNGQNQTIRRGSIASRPDVRPQDLVINNTRRPRPGASN
jgi:hypothetical protein